MSLLFKKPSNMKWVDLAIWIDENFYKEDCDLDTAYVYIWLLAYMLASKRRYFDSQRDYEDFASSLAYDTFQRMSSTEKAPVKSVLNYMKSVLSFRKMAFNTQRRQKIIDPKFDEEWDPIAYSEKCKSSYEVANRGTLFDGVVDVLNTTPELIKNAIPKVYRANKVEYENIYISCLLSMLNKVTLPNQYIDKLETKINESSIFDEVKYYKRHLNGDIILWNLPDHMNNLIMVILNKVSIKLVDEIKELTNDIKISDTDFKYVMTSGFTTGGSNETDY